jgi:hypothetical protein
LAITAIVTAREWHVKIAVISAPEAADGASDFLLISMHPAINPLTLEEHRELGKELSAINSRMRELCNLVVIVYGPQNRASFSFLKTAESVERLCQEMQTQVTLDHPGYSVGKIYL